MKAFILAVMTLVMTASVQATTFEDALASMDEANASRDSTHPGYAKAFDAFQRMSEEGHPGAKYHLGILHFYGLGGALFDQYKAVKLIEQAAEADYFQAQSLLGLMIEKSDGMMVTTDEAVAVSWYEKAASQGHCVSIRRLANAYERGELGLPKSEKISGILREQEKGCRKR
ncbi:MAG: tetratricopeptide repeat protein [Pseudomonadota bacterium]